MISSRTAISSRSFPSPLLIRSERFQRIVRSERFQQIVRSDRFQRIFRSVLHPPRFTIAPYRSNKFSWVVLHAVHSMSHISGTWTGKVCRISSPVLAAYSSPSTFFSKRLHLRNLKNFPLWNRLLHFTECFAYSMPQSWLPLSSICVKIP